MRPPDGVAHFLEHKLFEQPDGVNAMQRFGRTGASPNAFTSQTMTAYYFECTEQFYENLEILLDYVYTPYFTDENVQKEQGIIGQEIGMIEDDPATRGYFSLLQGLYQTHPIRTSIAGSVESISRITKETLYTCHRAFYSPANMALCVCGDVDAERVLDMARRLSPKDSLHIAGRFYGDEPQRVYQPRQEQEMEISLPLALMGWKDDPARFGDDPVFYRNVAEIAAACLCGPSSPLYHRLFEQGLITRDFTCEYLFFPGGGCLVLGGESRDPDETFRQVRQQVEEYAKNGMDEALFTRVMRFAYGMCVRVLDGLDETCRVQVEAAFAGSSYLDLPEMYRRMRVEDVSRFFSLFAGGERAALSIIWPKGHTAG